MRKLLLMLPAAMLLAAPAMSGEKIDLSDDQQAKLERSLDGRTAGEPRACIGSNDQRQMKVISDDILIFSSSRNAKTVYVNKPYGGCRNADRNIFVYSRPGASLCRGETVDLVDSSSRMAHGSCAFGEFVPYTKDAG